MEADVQDKYLCGLQISSRGRLRYFGVSSLLPCRTTWQCVELSAGGKSCYVSHCKVARPPVLPASLRIVSGCFLVWTTGLFNCRNPTAPVVNLLQPYSSIILATFSKDLYEFTSTQWHLNIERYKFISQLILFNQIYSPAHILHSNLSSSSHSSLRFIHQLTLFTQIYPPSHTLHSNLSAISHSSLKFIRHFTLFTQIYPPAHTLHSNLSAISHSSLKFIHQLTLFTQMFFRESGQRSVHRYSNWPWVVGVYAFYHNVLHLMLSSYLTHS